MMMTNLFSMFDASMSLMSISFFSFILLLGIMPISFWGVSIINYFKVVILSLLSNEILQIFGNPYKGMAKMFTSIFVLLFILNFTSLFPHIFAVTSHFYFTMPLSFSMWVSIMLFLLLNMLKSFLSHLIPVGTPTPLLSFMVLVEVVSNLIRPMSLMFRLTANLMAGHLMMEIIGSSFIKSNLCVVLAGSLTQSFLVCLEMGVSLVQAYVFFVLLVLYSSEVKN